MVGRFKQALLEKGDMSGMTQKGGHKRSTKSGAGLTKKGVRKYRRQNPGSKLQTAVTTPPSKLKPGSKAAKRRKSFCARSRGWTGERGKAARRRWNCSTDANPNALQRMAEMVIEGMTSGENPMLTGDRVGDFMGRLKKGKVKRGRRGGGSAVSKDKKKFATHKGREKTDQEYFDQIKRIKKKTANTSTRYGQNKDMINMGRNLQALINAEKEKKGTEPPQSAIDYTVQATSDDRSRRRASKDAARSLFTSHMKKAYQRRTKPRKDYT